MAKKKNLQLTNEELLKIENFELRERINNLMSDDLDKQLKIVDLELALSNARATLRKKELHDKLSNIRSNKQAVIQERREYLTTIGKEKKLEEGWGFNPDTGEIILKEETNE